MAPYLSFGAPLPNRVFAVQDYPNIALLLLLYTLQGIPMGFSAAIPLILKERGASFSDIALFGVSSLPFSAKLFWAPIVDSQYLESVGR